MTIESIVRKATEKGFLSLSLELALDRALDRPIEAEEYEAVVRLQRAIREGKVHTVARRSCINAMEEANMPYSLVAAYICPRR